MRWVRLKIKGQANKGGARIARPIARDVIATVGSSGCYIYMPKIVVSAMGLWMV